LSFPPLSRFSGSVVLLTQPRCRSSHSFVQFLRPSFFSPVIKMIIPPLRSFCLIDEPPLVNVGCTLSLFSLSSAPFFRLTYCAFHHYRSSSFLPFCLFYNLSNSPDSHLAFSSVYRERTLKTIQFDGTSFLRSSQPLPALSWELLAIPPKHVNRSKCVFTLN